MDMGRFSRYGSLCQSRRHRPVICFLVVAATRVVPGNLARLDAGNPPHRSGYPGPPVPPLPPERRAATGRGFRGTAGVFSRRLVTAWLESRQTHPHGFRGKTGNIADFLRQYGRRYASEGGPARWGFSAYPRKPIRPRSCGGCERSNIGRRNPLPRSGARHPGKRGLLEPWWTPGPSGSTGLCGCPLQSRITSRKTVARLSWKERFCKLRTD